MRKRTLQLPHIRIVRFYTKPHVLGRYQLNLLAILRFRTNRWQLSIGESGSYSFFQAKPSWNSKIQSSLLLQLLMARFHSKYILEATIRSDQMNEQRYGTNHFEPRVKIIVS